MSFILDALKKSESDRQRQSGPSLFEVKVAPPRRSLPVWAVAIAVLLGINVIVVSWMLLRRAPAQQPAPATAPVAAPPAAIARSPAATASTAPPQTGPADVTASSAAAARTGAAGAVPPPASGAAAEAVPPRTAAGTALAGASAAQAAAPLPAPDPGADQAPADDNPSDYAPAVEPAAGSAAAEGTPDALPLYQQIVASAGLPALHLDLHVFAARPKDRFVMINMQRVGEGDSLSNGVQVDAIRPDGVVLRYHGTRFLLPRN